MTWTNAVEAALQDMVNSGALAGAATLVWRRGKGAETACAGWRDVEAGAAMTRDTLFRIASMTKPINHGGGVALDGTGPVCAQGPHHHVGA